MNHITVSPAGRLEVDGRKLMRDPKVQRDVAALRILKMELGMVTAALRGTNPHPEASERIESVETGKEGQAE